MAKEDLFRVLVVAATIGCSHTIAQGRSAPTPAAKQTCYRPNAEPFVSLLPEGMSLEEGVAKGIVGSLEKEDIRHIIRSKIYEVRECYERVLVRQPLLNGRVTIQFVIAGDGTVSDSRLDSSTLGSAAAETCIAERACGWRFPPTNGGGRVIVTYPFNLTSSKSGSE